MCGERGEAGWLGGACPARGDAVIGHRAAARAVRTGRANGWSHIGEGGRGRCQKREGPGRGRGRSTRWNLRKESVPGVPDPGER